MYRYLIELKREFRCDDYSGVAIFDHQASEEDIISWLRDEEFIEFERDYHKLSYHLVE